MDIIKADSPEPECERFARFQSLQAGQYWRACAAIPEQGIAADTVLLIQSIRWVDNAAHTIILRPHPSKIGTTVTLQIPQDDGTVRERWFEYREHRFLLEEFLRLWVFEPDHKIIRNKELQAIQGRVNELQAELIEAQSNPALMERVVKEALHKRLALTAPKSEEESAPAARSTEVSTHLEGEQLVSLAGGSLADAIGTGLTSELVTALKTAANHQHEVATIQSEWIQGKTAEISTCIKAQAPFYEEQAAAALAHVEDVRVYVAKLKNGIESLDLYVGKDVHVTRVREGATAPSDVPLTFVQRKLMMDEELSAWADVDERFDFESEERFFAALKESDALVNQIFPTERCVLVMAVTRRYIDYGDNWGNYHRNEENSKVFMLARNGMNIHRIFSPVESHLKSARLFPSRDDQNQLFRGVDGREIKFQDVDYTDRLAAHDGYALHYKRFLLLVCGLDHRLKLFGDFYEGPPSLNFVSLEFQAKHCRFLYDDEGVIGERRPSVKEWIASKNAYLGSGSRVLCSWGDLMTPTTAPGACRDTREPNGAYEFRYSPGAKLSQAIAYRDGDALCVDVEVHGYGSQFNERRFNCKVNITAFENGYWRYCDLPYLVLDAVTPEELHWYIHNREERKDHLSYIRFFKHAEKLLLAERERERVPRQQLTQALADGGVAAGSSAEHAVQQAVVAWRAANRGKPLPQLEDGKAATAWTTLLNLMFLLTRKSARQGEEVSEFVSALGYEPLRLVVTGDAKLVVYAAPAESEMDNRLEPHAWVHRIVLVRGKTRWMEKSRSWALLPAVAAAEITLHEWESAGAWAGKRTLFANLKRKQELMAFAGGSVERLSTYSQTMDLETFAREFTQWKTLRDQLTEKSKRVVTPDFLVPIGMLAKAKQGYLCVGTSWPHIVLYRLAPNERARQLVRDEYLRWYEHKEAARERFEEDLERDSRWGLFEASADLVEAGHGGYTDGDLGIFTAAMRGYTGHDVLLKQRLGAYLQDDAELRCWVSPDALDEYGELALDEVLGNRLPDDYEPVLVIEIHLNRWPEGYAGPRHWFDICPRGTKTIALLEGFPRPCGYRPETHYPLSPGRARDFIREKLPGCIQAAGSEPELAMVVPAGVERWYAPGSTTC